MSVVPVWTLQGSSTMNVESGSSRVTEPAGNRFHVITGGKRKLAIVLNDIHFPFEDKILLPRVLRAIRDLQPDHVILNGDIVDHYTLSTFAKDSARKETLSDEIEACKRFLASLREILPNAEISYTEGNHEDRLRRYLRSNARALDVLDCLKFENLFDLSGFDVTYYGQDGFMLNRGFLVRHGSIASKHAGVSAKDEFYKSLVSGISGHTHRFGRFDVRTDRGVFFWVENGCLCDLNPEYISGTPNWMHGFSLLEYNRDRVHQRSVRIVNRVVNIDGRVY